MKAVSASAGALPGATVARLRRVDRLVAPRGDAASASFIVRYLYVAHGLRERVAWPIHRVLRGRLLGTTGAGELVATAEAAIADVRRLVPDAAAQAGSWIVDTDYPGSPRARTIVFLFTRGERHPSLVVKRARIAASGEAPSLGRERKVLESLRGRLPDSIALTIPRVVAHRTIGGFESVALTWLRGRSAYAEMQTRLAPVHAVETHFDAAARWLARFHEATVDRGQVFQPPTSEARLREVLVAAARPAELGWFAQLCESCAARPVPPVRSHGDFWARNLLLHVEDAARDPAGVVDWEASVQGSPFDDLFQFATSYGLAYPWQRYRRANTEEALRRTFLLENRVSHAVRMYLRTYCSERGMDPSALASWFRLFLLGRAQASAPKGNVWIRFDEMLATAGRSVFSG
jgi:aminoglycoside phosphotransferase (APT) family kinase protein